MYGTRCPSPKTRPLSLSIGLANRHGAPAVTAVTPVRDAVTVENLRAAVLENGLELLRSEDSCALAVM